MSERGGASGSSASEARGWRAVQTEHRLALDLAGQMRHHRGTSSPTTHVSCARPTVDPSKALIGGAREGLVFGQGADVSGRGG